MRTARSGRACCREPGSDEDPSDGAAGEGEERMGEDADEKGEEREEEPFS
jgi:hypothetical protein